MTLNSHSQPIFSYNLEQNVSVRYFLKMDHMYNSHLQAHFEKLVMTKYVSKHPPPFKNSFSLEFILKKICSWQI